MRPLPHQGWSYGNPQRVRAAARIGPEPHGGSDLRQFPNDADQVAFVTTGSEPGKKYGQQGQGIGRMPGFGAACYTPGSRSPASRRRTSGGL